MSQTDTDRTAETATDTETVEAEPIESDAEIETPATVQPTNDLSSRFEHITLPDNVNHEAVIAVYYKRYIMILGGIFITIVGLLFASGIISLEFTTLLSTYGSVILIPLFILFWLYEAQANN